LSSAATRPTGTWILLEVNCTSLGISAAVGRHGGSIFPRARFANCFLARPTFPARSVSSRHPQSQTRCWTGFKPLEGDSPAPVQKPWRRLCRMGGLFGPNRSGGLSAASIRIASLSMIPFRGSPKSGICSSGLARPQCARAGPSAPATGPPRSRKPYRSTRPANDDRHSPNPRRSGAVMLRVLLTRLRRFTVSNTALAFLPTSARSAGRLSSRCC